MNQHRENLLKLIKLIESIKEKEKIENIQAGISNLKLELYILRNESIISIRELIKMFIEELNSEYMKCNLDDEIVKFIEGMLMWLNGIYDNIVEERLTDNESIKTLKICGQLIKDLSKVYEGSKDTKELFDGVAMAFQNKYLEFGKRNKPIKEDYTINNSYEQPITINLSINGDNTNIDEFTKSFEKYVKNVFNNINGR